jgi:uncharacterized protein with HEPN domain
LNATSSISRDWRLHLDDLIGAAEKIGRLVAGRSLAQWQADEAAVDAVLFNPQVIGESLKRLPAERLAELPESHRRDPIRLRDLIAHRYFALEASVIHDAATRHVPDLSAHALKLRDHSRD